MMTLACPACRSDLQPGYLRGVAIDRCVECRGLWVETGELGVLLGTPADLPQAPEPGKDNGRRCPACGVGMFERRYDSASKVRLDACPRCHGIWLDPGELQALEPVVRALPAAFPEGRVRRFIDAYKGIDHHKR